MADKTEIAWCDSTLNPWIGCTKVGPGCDHCYAEADFDLRKHRAKWGSGNPRSRTSAVNWKKPIQWNAKPFYECACGWRGDDLQEHATACGYPSIGRYVETRRRVFCASLADVFDNEVPRQWRQDLFDLILATPNLDWQLLTKRIGNAAKMLQAVAECRGTMMDANDRYVPLPNVWIGATICNQEEADRDIAKLLAVPARVRFLSMEPLLGPVDMRRWLPAGRKAMRAGTGEPFFAPHYFMTRCEHCGWTGSSEMAREVSYGDDADAACPSCDRIFACDEVAGISWVITGGESGPKARPSHPDWFRDLRDKCAAAGVPFFMKQMSGERGKTIKDIAAFPADLQIREFPYANS